MQLFSSPELCAWAKAMHGYGRKLAGRVHAFEVYPAVGDEALVVGAAGMAKSGSSAQTTPRSTSAGAAYLGVTHTFT